MCVVRQQARFTVLFEEIAGGVKRKRGREGSGVFWSFTKHLNLTLLSWKRNWQVQTAKSQPMPT